MIYLNGEIIIVFYCIRVTEHFRKLLEYLVIIDPLHFEKLRVPLIFNQVHDPFSVIWPPLHAPVCVQVITLMVEIDKEDSKDPILIPNQNPHSCVDVS